MKESEDAQRIELSEVENKVLDSVTLSKRDYKLVKSLDIKLNAEIGSVDVTLEKLFSFKSGEILALNKEVNEPIYLTVDNNVVAEGNLIAIDGSFGVEITNVAK